MWGPWIEHDGKRCPCRGEFVHAVADREGIRPDGTWAKEAKFIATGGASWFWDREGVNIIRYRIRKPKGLQILEANLKTLDTDRTPASVRVAAE